MIFGTNPIVSTIENYDVFNTKEKGVDLEESEFVIAFGVRNYLDGTYKSDSSLVRW